MYLPPADLHQAIYAMTTPLIQSVIILGLQLFDLFPDVYRIVADTGKFLDWITKLATEKKWKVTRINFWPGRSVLVGLHPDALRIMLKAGKPPPSPLPPLVLGSLHLDTKSVGFTPM